MAKFPGVLPMVKRLKLKQGTLVRFVNPDYPKSKPIWGFVSEIPIVEDFDEGQEHTVFATIPSFGVGDTVEINEKQILAVGGRFDEKTGKIV